VARQGFDPVYGARPLKRYLQRALETRVACALVGNEARPGATIRVDVANDELSVEIENGEAVGAGVNGRR